MSVGTANGALGRVREAIDRLGAIADLNAITRMRGDVALGEARDLDAAAPDARGPLHGLPIVVKDNIAVAGMPWTGASPALDGLVAKADAPALARLRAAGAVPVAQANMHELALGITSANAHHGAVRNPADPARMAGGSSGGTAAAVASGAVPAGLASDTGGSGRLPAALCGCIGFRPTVGRYPGGGLLTLSPTLDTPTLMARGIDLLVRMDAVLTGALPGEGPVPPPPPPPSPERVRIGLARGAFWQGLHSPVRDAAEAATERLRAAGVEVVEVELPELRALTDASGFAIAMRETADIWHAFARERLGTDLATLSARVASPDVRGLLASLAADGAPPPDAYRAAMQEARPALRRHLADAMARERLDALAHPTAPVLAPMLGETEEVELDGARVPLFPAMTRNTLPTAVACVPAISLPAGRMRVAGVDLPFGLELVGRHGADARLLALAQRLAPALRP